VPGVSKQNIGIPKERWMSLQSKVKEKENKKESR